MFPILSLSPCLISPHPLPPVPCVLGLQWTAASVPPCCSPLSLSAPGTWCRRACLPAHAILLAPIGPSVLRCCWAQNCVLWLNLYYFMPLTLLLEYVYVFCFQFDPHSAGPAYCLWGAVLGIPPQDARQSQPVGTVTGGRNR